MAWSGTSTGGPWVDASRGVNNPSRGVNAWPQEIFVDCLDLNMKTIWLVLVIFWVVAANLSKILKKINQASAKPRPAPPVPPELPAKSAVQTRSRSSGGTQPRAQLVMTPARLAQLSKEPDEPAPSVLFDLQRLQALMNEGRVDDAFEEAAFAEAVYEDVPAEVVDDAKWGQPAPARAESWDEKTDPVGMNVSAEDVWAVRQAQTGSLWLELSPTALCEAVLLSAALDTPHAHHRRSS